MRTLAALAIHTIKDSLRKNVLVLVLVFLIFAVLASSVLPASMPEDHIKLTISWCLWAMIFVGTIASIFLVAPNLGHDIEEKTIYTVLTKPVSRWQLILGRFLGYEVVMLLLLAPMAVISYGLIHHVASRVPRLPDAPAVLCSMSPTLCSDLWQEPGMQEDKLSESAKEQAQKYFLLYGTDPRQQLVFEFKNLDPENFDEEVSFSVRPNITSDDPQIAPELALFVKVVNGANPDKTEEVELPEVLDGRKSFAKFHRTVFEGANSAKVIIYRKTPSEVFTVAMNQKRLELMAHTRPFIGNYMKSMLMVFLSYTLITLVAICASTFLTGHVAVLACFFVFFLGGAMEVIRSTVEVLAPGRLVFTGLMSWQVDVSTQGGRLIHTLNSIVRYFLNGLTVVLPDFSHYNTTEYIVDNLAIPAAVLLVGLRYLVLFGAILFIVAVAVFRYREVAK